MPKTRKDIRFFGDLLTANLYRIESGASSVTVENYYEPDCPQVEIELSPQLTPSKNAQRYYKLFTKLKNAEIEMEKQRISTLSYI